MAQNAELMAGMALLWLSVSTAFATTNYVATTGSDTNSGTESAPKLTIAAALTNCVNGDTILVGPGTYIVTNQIFITNGVNIRSMFGYEATTVKRDTTMIGGEPVYATRIFWIKYTNAIVDGFTISDGYTPRSKVDFSGCGGNVMIGVGETTTAQGDGGILRNCRVINGSSYGYGGGVFVRGTGTVSHCIISNNTAMYGQGGGVYLRSGDTSVVLEDSLVCGNTAVWYPEPPPYNNNQFTGNGGGVLVVFGATITGCTIVSNTCTTPAAKSNKQGGGVWHASLLASYPNHCVSNTIVWGNRHVDGATGFNTPNNVDAEPAIGYGLPPYINCYYTEDYAPDSPDPFVAAWAHNFSLPTNSPRLEIGWAPEQGLFVATNGNDSSSGRSWTTAVHSITKAISVAHRGTRITVGAGSYTNWLETFPLTLAYRTGITLLGENRDTTIVNAAGSGNRVVALTNSQDVTISGLTFTGGSRTNGHGAGIALWNSSGIVLSDCAISSNTLDAVAGDVQGGGIYSFLSGITLSNCLVRENFLRGEYSPMGGGICIQGGSMAIHTSIISTNKVVSRNPGPSGNASGAGVANTNGLCLLRSSLVSWNSCGTNDNPAERGDGFFATGASATSTLENCTVVYNDGQGINSLNGTASVSNSILWGNGDDLYGTISVGYSDMQTTDPFWTNKINGCISTDPLFVDAGTTNYRLTNAWPCMDKAPYQEWMTTATDLDGRPRILGKAADFGAYETNYTDYGAYLSIY